MAETPITFGDNVRVIATPETENVGLAGLTGQVYGHTTPSATNVDVIGQLRDDVAINVHFEARDESLGSFLNSLNSSIMAPEQKWPLMAYRKSGRETWMAAGRKNPRLNPHQKDAVYYPVCSASETGTRDERIGLILFIQCRSDAGSKHSHNRVRERKKR